MQIEHWDEKVDGAFSELSLREKLERAGYDITLYEYAEGAVFSEHAHPKDKLNAVVSGHFRVSIGDESLVLKAGDSIYIPSGVKHRAEVVGTEAVLCFDATKG